jgi:hypothetical protein
VWELSEQLVLPTVLDELAKRVTSSGVAAQDLYQVVHAMQRMGIPQVDIEVHIERIRAVNDATDQDQATEENCVQALEMVIGYSGSFSLSWDHAEMASIYVPRVVDEVDLRECLKVALAPSDMLPPRPSENALPARVNRLPEILAAPLNASEWRPARADEFRVPKGPFTTRPAALLAAPDRLVYEALAARAAPILDEFLPHEVVWPRMRNERDTLDVFRESPIHWNEPYVVKADIAGFYQNVDHSLLAMILGGSLGLQSDLVQAVEHFLGAVTGSSIGLPQGPNASDTFASAYLSLIDRKLMRDGWRFVRFADDYLIAAESMADGRGRLEALERLLAEHNLRLSDDKSIIMRSSTYTEALRKPPAALAKLREELRERRASALLKTDDSDEIAEILTEYGADEEMMFGLLYHGSLSLEEVIEGLGDALNPEDVAVYRAFLSRVDQRLSRGKATPDMADSFVVVRDCVAHLAAVQDVTVIAPVERLLRWFPGLAPVAAVFYESAASLDSEQVDVSLLRLLSSDDLPDWASAWLCRAVQRRPQDVSPQLLRSLSTEVLSGGRPLTGVCAAWALAGQHALTREHWVAAFERAGGPLRTELVLEREVQPELYRATAEVPGTRGSLSGEM